MTLRDLVKHQHSIFNLQQNQTQTQVIKVVLKKRYNPT